MTRDNHEARTNQYLPDYVPLEAAASTAGLPQGVKDPFTGTVHVDIPAGHPFLESISEKWAREEREGKA